MNIMQCKLFLMQYLNMISNNIINIVKKAIKLSDGII